MAVSTYLSIITLNVSGLYAPVRRLRVAEQRKEQDPCTCCLQETQFTYKNTHRLKVKGWQKVFNENGNEKKVGVVIQM